MSVPHPTAELRAGVAVCLPDSPLRDGVVAMLRRSMVPYRVLSNDEQLSEPHAVVLVSSTAPLRLRADQVGVCFCADPGCSLPGFVTVSPAASSIELWEGLCSLEVFASLVPTELPALSAREAEILSQVCMGRSNEEIARLCFVSTATVKTHLMRIFRKLGVNDRAGAVYVGMRRGIVDGDES